MVEAMILISESAYKQLLNCQKKYLELIQHESVPDRNIQLLNKDKDGECHCEDQYGEGLDTSANCECTKGKDGVEISHGSLIVNNKTKIPSFKTSSQYFSDLVRQNWYKRSPRKIRAVAEAIFYSPGVLIGTDNTLHFEGSKIEDSNILDIIRNKVNGGKSYIPGKIIVDRMLEKSSLHFKMKSQPKEKTQKKENVPKDWYELL